MEPSQGSEICIRCIQRLRGIRESEPISLTFSEGDPQPSNVSICPLCLGLFQGICCIKADLRAPSLSFQDIGRGVTGRTLSEAAGSPPPLLHSFNSLPAALASLIKIWQFDSFALEITLPAAFAVRSQASKWKLDHAQDAPDVKETLKRICISEISAALPGTRFDPGAAMRLCLSCTLDQTTDSEASWIESNQIGGRKRQRQRRRHPRGRGQACLSSADEGIAASPIQQSMVASPALISKLSAMNREEFFRNCPKSSAELLSPPPVPATLVISPRRLPVYIGGRYLKCHRNIAQSPWIMDGKRRGDSSVQEEIAKVVVPLLQGDSYTFLSSGREDADVRMLGSGRPFALEVWNSRVPSLSMDALTAAQTKIETDSGGGVAVKGMRMLESSEIAEFRDDGGEKRKQYVAVCWIPRQVTKDDLAVLRIGGIRTNREGIDNEEEEEDKEEETSGAIRNELTLTLRQKTPLRVLHRRANLERLRVVFSMRAEALPELPGGGYFLLRLTTQAGTYVKEFVHGDRGRTNPSIKGLLGAARAECVCLDVTDVLDCQPPATCS